MTRCSTLNPAAAWNMMRVLFLCVLVCQGVFSARITAEDWRVFDVTAYGAKGDGKTMVRCYGGRVLGVCWICFCFLPHLCAYVCVCVLCSVLCLVRLCYGFVVRLLFQCS